MMSDRIGLVGLVHVASMHHRGTVIAKRRDQYWKVLTVARVSYVNESHVTLRRYYQNTSIAKAGGEVMDGGGGGATIF